MFKILISVFVTLFIANDVLAVNWGFVGAGARSSGMGGAFIAVADDATAIFWNPAGLTHLRREEISLVGRLENGTWNVPAEEQDISSPESTSSLSLNFASFAYPIKLGNRNFVLATGVTNILDFAYNWRSTDNVNNPGEKLTFIENNSGKVYQMFVGTAIDVLPDIALGTTFNWHFGDVFYKGIEYNSTGAISQKQNTQASFSAGASSTFGIFIDLSSKLHFGSVVKMPLKDIESNFEIESLYNSTYYSNTNNLKFGGTSKLSFPATYGAGISWTPSDVITFDIDYDLIKWSNYKTNGTTPKHTNGLEKFIDITQWHFGLEFLLSKSFLNDYPMPVRLGAYTDPNPQQSENKKFTNTTFFTFGFGIPLESGQLDFSLEYGRRDYFGVGKYYENIVRGISSLIFRL